MLRNTTNSYVSIFDNTKLFFSDIYRKYITHEMSDPTYTFVAVFYSIKI